MSRLRAPVPEPRMVVCLKCVHEAAADHRFPERCFVCGASSHWIVAAPEGFGKYARLIDRLYRDPRVAARSRSVRGYRASVPASADRAGSLD